MPHLYLKLILKQKKLTTQEIHFNSQFIKNIQLYLPCVFFELNGPYLRDLFDQLNEETVDLWKIVQLVYDNLPPIPARR